MIMATVDRFAPAHWPRRRLLVGVLAVSLVLNLFFIAGAVWIRFAAPAAPPSYEQRFESIAAQLDLTPDQRSGFDRYIAAMQARGTKMRQEIAPLIAGAWNEMAEPQADAGRIMRRFDDASEKWRAFQHESTTKTLDFLALLSPAQRKQFITLVRHRHPGSLHHRSHQN